MAGVCLIINSNNEYCNISQSSFFYRTLLVAASEVKSNISNANLDKNKKKLLLYFDTSHANQNKYFFLTLRKI